MATVAKRQSKAGPIEGAPENLDDILMEEEVTATAGCGIMGRYPLIAVVTFAALGLAVGIVSRIVEVFCCCHDVMMSVSLRSLCHAVHVMQSVQSSRVRKQPCISHLVVYPCHIGLELLAT